MGTDYYSIWPKKPGLVFKGCSIYGTAIHLYAGTRFEDCAFEDKPYTDGRVHRAGYLYDAGGGGESATFDRCRFTATKVRGVYMGGTTKEVFTRCTFVHGNTAIANLDFQSSFTNSRITSCTFTESSALSAGSRVYFIGVTDVTVGSPAGGDPPTTTTSKVKWNSASSTGKVGPIAPGVYA